MKYKKIKTRGQGGFGIVDEVENEKGVTFALKTFSIHPSMAGIEEQAKKRFLKEAKYQQLISHPNIVKVLEISSDEEPPFFIMDLATCSMADEMNMGALDATNFLDCFYDVMAGLEEIHSLSIYHRDLKPANVLKFKKHYAISDFGLMSINQTGVSSLTNTGMAKNSDLYTAPEITQDLKFASVQSDIYSLGCMLHDFIGVSNRVPCNEISETSEYGNLLLSATRKDPTRRFRSVAAFRDALDAVSKTTSTTIKTLAATKVYDSLKKDINEFDEEDIAALSNFLSSNVKQDEKAPILEEISLAHIQKVILNTHYSTYIAKVFCEYVRNNSFDYNFCDTLANRVVEFMKLNTVEIVSEGMFALLYMGYKHNRWYVEKKAINYFCGDIENKLLQRMLMEIRVDGNKFCSAIQHLNHSIHFSNTTFNAEIKKVYTEVCKK